MDILGGHYLPTHVLVYNLLDFLWHHLAAWVQEKMEGEIRRVGVFKGKKLEGKGTKGMEGIGKDEFK